jgi:hypothetical protein
MKFRKVALLFMILIFGMVIEGVNAARIAMKDESFEPFKEFDLSDFFRRRGGLSGPSHEFTESLTAEAAGVTAIEVSNAFGDVVVRRSGDPNAPISIGLRKEVFTRKPETAETTSNKLKIVMNREGSRLRISTTRNPRVTYRTKTHFEITTPLPVNVQIVNKNGRTVVEGAKAVDLSGEYDEMRVTDVTGECVARNRHGNLEVISAALGCRVVTDFGDVHIERLLGPSNAEVSHGNLRAIDIAALTAKLKFSDLMARKIGGNLSTTGEHSDLQIDDVKGEVTLNNQGDIDIQNITGRVSIENRRGHVRLLKAASAVMIKNSFDGVTASDVGGMLDITNQHGSIRAQRFLKGARLETDSEDVDVSDFEGTLNVVTKRGDVTVKPVRKVLSAMDIQVDIGEIRLGLPAEIDAMLDASVERGDVEGSIGALKSMEQGKRLLRATVGAGGPLLRLRSRLGDIRLSSDEDLDVEEPDLPDAPDIDTRYHAPLGADPLPVAPRVPEPPSGAKPPKLPKAPKIPSDVRPPAPPAPPAKPTPEGA